MTDWKDSRLMPLSNETLSAVSTTWELVIRCDLLLDDKEEYLEDGPSPKVFIV